MPSYNRFTGLSVGDHDRAKIKKGRGFKRMCGGTQVRKKPQSRGVVADTDATVLHTALGNSSASASRAPSAAARVDFSLRAAGQRSRAEVSSLASRGVSSSAKPGAFRLSMSGTRRSGTISLANSVGLEQERSSPAIRAACADIAVAQCEGGWPCARGVSVRSTSHKDDAWSTLKGEESQHFVIYSVISNFVI